jgi:hypothetical protein
MRQWLVPRGWSAPVSIYDLVIVILSAITLPALAMQVARERRNLEREDPAPGISGAGLPVAATQVEVM